MKHSPLVQTTTLHGRASKQIAVSLFAALLAAAPFQSALAQSNPVLGTAASFAVLSGAAVTCTGSTLTGDVGSFVAGGPVIQSSCVINGAVLPGDAIAVAASNDFLVAYAAVAALPASSCTAVLPATLGTVSLPPGTYCFDAAATLSGQLTLDGPADGVWLFRVGTLGTGALTGTNFSMVMTGGGQPSNVTWWVADAATMTTSDVQGTILAGAAISFTGGSLIGRDLAKAAVTLTGTAVTVPVAAPVVVIPPDVIPPVVVPAVGSLGLASNYQVLSGASISLTGSTVNGNAGTFAPGGAVTQTGSPITGAISYGDAAAISASVDFLGAYAALAALPASGCDALLVGTLAGVTLPPGTYCFDAAANVAGLLTLDGPADAAWIIRVGSSGFGALTGTGFSVAMSGGASACNVTWYVADAVTMTSSALQGNFLAGAAITTTGTTLNGRGLAKAAVTMTGSTVSACTP